MTAYIKSKSFYKSKSISSRGTAVLNMVVIISLLLMGSLYLFQTNSVIGQVYQIRQQKESLQNLLSENQTLQVEAAQLQSPANLEGIAEKLGMVATDEIIYLEKEGVMAIQK